eukprot:1233517-Amphidinium_carterae.1
MVSLQERDFHRLVKGSKRLGVDVLQFQHQGFSFACMPPLYWLAAIESQVDSVADKLLTPLSEVQQFWSDTLGCWSWLAEHPLMQTGLHKDAVPLLSHYDGAEVFK